MTKRRSILNHSCHSIGDSVIITHTLACFSNRIVETTRKIMTAVNKNAFQGLGYQIKSIMYGINLSPTKKRISIV
jgi:hypothetical protein